MPSDDMKNILQELHKMSFIRVKTMAKKVFMPIVLEEIFQEVQAAGFPMP